MTERAFGVAVWFVAGALVLWSPSGVSSGASRIVQVHTGPERSSVHAVFGPRLSAALAPAIETRLVSSPGTLASLDAVLREPRDVAFAQFNLYRRFVAEHPAAHKLEFYGDVPVCVLLVARAGSPWMLSSTEVPDALVPSSIDLGPADGDAAATLAPLLRSAFALGDALLEHRGGARALARVQRRDTEVAAFIEFPNVQTPIVSDVLGNDSVEFVTSIASVLRGARLRGGMTLVPAEVEMPQPGPFGSERSIRTLCTSLGLVVHADAAPDLIDAVVHAVVRGELVNSDHWSFGFVSRGWNRLWDLGREWSAQIAGWF